MSKDLVVGIDLGTTNTVVAIYESNEPKIIENFEGDYTTPSVILFPQKSGTNIPNAIIGKTALRQSVNKPERGVHEVKRLMGKQFHEVQSLLKYLSYKVIENNSGELIIYIEKDIILTPIDVSSAILRKIKNDVGKKKNNIAITKAVVTVPAHFTVSQRKATLEAARKAGFEVLKLLNEPSAAALNYFYEDMKNDEEEFVTTTTEIKRVLVYDLGGGTFDVAILERKKNNIDIIAIDGDSHLGGHDFDNRILDYVLDKIEQRYKIDVRGERINRRRLLTHCKAAKEELSTPETEETPVVIEGFHKDIEILEIVLTKEQFENICDDLFQRTIEIVQECIRCAKLSKDNIDEIILAGGSSRIPKIQKMLKEYFGKELKLTVHLEECVAKGAALQAAMLSQNPKQKIKELKITEVISSSLGIGEVAHKMDFLIRKNTPIPAKASVVHTTVFDQQKSIVLKIYEGERLDTRKNICLGNFKITDLTPAPPGKCKIKITMEIDINGILTVTAQEKSKDNIKELQIVVTNASRSGAIQDGTVSFREDERFAETAKMNEFLITYCEMVKYNIKEKKLTSTFQHIYDRCHEVQKQILLPGAGTDEKKMAILGKGLLRICEPVIKKCGFKKIPTSSEIQRKLQNAESDDDEEGSFFQVHKKYEEKSKFKIFGRK